MTNLVKSSQVKSLSRVQLFATPVDCSPPGSSVHGILQARILEQVTSDQRRQHIKKQRCYFANKGLSGQNYGFSSSHVGCESWTIKKAECQRIDVFELWCWGKLLRVPWTTKRSNQLILKEISPEYSLEGMMLKLKLRYFGHLIRRTDSFEKTLMLQD